MQILNITAPSRVLEGTTFEALINFGAPLTGGFFTVRVTGSQTGAVSSSTITTNALPGQAFYRLPIEVPNDGQPGGGSFTIAVVGGPTLVVPVIDNVSPTLPSPRAVYQNIMLRAETTDPLPSAFGFFATARDAIRQIEPFALSTTSVALTSYQFFTGKTPSKDGLQYLVNSPANPSDLNDAAGIYKTMNTENRYINFSANLGLVGEGKAAFEAGYKALSFRQAVEKAYDAVIGLSTATAAGLNTQAAIDSVVGSQGYFQALAKERMPGFDQDLAMKAGMVGYLLVEGLKANVGKYARGVENFYIDLMDGTALHNVDLIGVYGPGTPFDI